MSATLIISIVNHSNPELLKDCLASISAAAAGIDYEVHVVDNCTGGRMVPELQVMFPEAHWLFNDRRRGFSFNHNRVLNTTKARYYCILNDDTVLGPGSLRTLVQALKEDASVGAIGPRLLNADGTIQDSVFKRWTLTNEAIAAFVLPRAMVHLKRRWIDPSQYGSQVASVAWLLGACLMVTDSAIRDAGTLDADSFPVANSEEIDWCERMRTAGYKIVFLPSASVVHLGSQTIKKEANAQVSWMYVEMVRTRLVYFRKHGGVFGEIVARGINLVASLWNSAMLITGSMRGSLKDGSIGGALLTNAAIARVTLTCSKNPVGPYCGMSAK